MDREDAQAASAMASAPRPLVCVLGICRRILLTETPATDTSMSFQGTEGKLFFKEKARSCYCVQCCACTHSQALSSDGHCHMLTSTLWTSRIQAALSSNQPQACMRAPHTPVRALAVTSQGWGAVQTPLLTGHQAQRMLVLPEQAQVRHPSLQEVASVPSSGLQQASSTQR